MLKELLESIDNDADRLQEVVFAFNDLESGIILEDLDDLDVGFQIIIEMAKHFSSEQVDLFCETLRVHTFVEEEIIEELFDEHDYLEEAEDKEDDDDLDEDDDEEDELDEIQRFKVVRRTAKVKRVLAQRGRAKEKLKGKADTTSFKRKFQYDKKKKRFIRRDKAISVGAFKKHNKKFVKLMKRRQHR